MRYILAVIILLSALCVQAQLVNSDTQFQRPLKDVLLDIETKFNVHLRFSGKDLDEKILNYADWRFRPTLNETLTNVLAPFDLIFLPDGAPDKFKIEAYRYHRRTVEEAKEFLNYLSELYTNKDDWEIRKRALKSCILDAIRLSPMPASPASKPIIINQRKMNGYDIKNFAIEVLPGVYECGSIYQPTKIKGKIPVVLCPNGHFADGRYNGDVQTRCAALARMGALAVSYDLFAWGESTLQFAPENHRKSMANTMQALNSTRILDYLLSLNYTDSTRVAITGGSGGGSHSILMSAIDDRIDVSVPTVMMSAIHYGGCPCESGNPIHLCVGGTNNVELAAMFAPKPQLIISDGGDWTSNVPVLEFPFLQRTYQFYGDKAIVKNAHFANEKHDYGISKRIAMYHFLADQLGLDLTLITDKLGKIDESAITVENPSQLYVFGNDVNQLPANAIKSFEELEALWDSIN